MGVISPIKLVEQVRAELVSIIPFNARQVTDTAGPKEPGESHQLLTVRVGDELFGLTLERIERILASVRLTPLPSTAEHFDGMADVGDGVIPVIDLRKQVARLEPPVLPRLNSAPSTNGSARCRRIAPSRLRSRRAVFTD